MVVPLKKEAVDWLAPLAFPQMKEKPRTCIRFFLQALGIDAPLRNKGRKECELYHKSLLLPDGQSGPTFYGKKDRYEARYGEAHSHLEQVEELLNSWCGIAHDEEDARAVAKVVYAERAAFFPQLIALVNRLLDEDTIRNECDTAQGQGNAAALSAFDIYYARAYGKRLILLPTMRLVDAAYEQDKLSFPDERKLTARLTSLLTDCCGVQGVLQGFKYAFLGQVDDNAESYELIRHAVAEFLRRCGLTYSCGQQNECIQVLAANKRANRENDAFLPTKAQDATHTTLLADKGAANAVNADMRCCGLTQVEQNIFPGKRDELKNEGSDAGVATAGSAVMMRPTPILKDDDFTLATMAKYLFSVEAMKSRSCVEDGGESGAACFVLASADSFTPLDAPARPLIPFVQPPKTPDELLALLFGEACATALAAVAHEAVFKADSRVAIPQAAQFFEEGFGMRTQECFKTCCALCNRASWERFYNSGNGGLWRAFFEKATPEACSLLQDFHHHRVGRAVFLMALFALFGCDMIDEVAYILNQRNFVRD